jgi:hypothetical protein
MLRFHRSVVEAPMIAKGDEEEDSCAERKEEEEEEDEAEGMRVQSDSEPLEPLDASL